MRNGKGLDYYQNIKVPILNIIGDLDEWAILPVDKEACIMESENKNAKSYILENCDHGFNQKRYKLAKLVSDFIVALN